MNQENAKARFTSGCGFVVSVVLTLAPMISMCSAADSAGISTNQALATNNTAARSTEEAATSTKATDPWEGHQKCSNPYWGDPMKPELCVEWTGSWPTGKVRAQAGHYTYWGVRLMVCNNCNGPTGWNNWVVAAEGDNYPLYVPSASGMKVGKYSWYKVCVMDQKGQPVGWSCEWSSDAVYLGD